MVTDDQVESLVSGIAELQTQVLRKAIRAMLEEFHDNRRAPQSEQTHVLVPVQPTWQMIDAAIGAAGTGYRDANNLDETDAKSVWAAMLRAATEEEKPTAKEKAAVKKGGGKMSAPDFIENTTPPALTFSTLSEVNVLRCREGFGQEIKDWSSAQWACAAGGEMGELQNLIKKEFRGDRIPDLDKKIGQEIADVVIYLDLLATSRGLNLGQLVREKFNEVSRRVNSKRFL